MLCCQQPTEKTTNRQDYSPSGGGNEAKTGQVQYIAGSETRYTFDPLGRLDTVTESEFLGVNLAAFSC